MRKLKKERRRTDEGGKGDTRSFRLGSREKKLGQRFLGAMFKESAEQRRGSDREIIITATRSFVNLIT